LSEPWRARYVDGHTAAIHDVILDVADEALIGRRATDATVAFTWPRAALSIEVLEPGAPGRPGTTVIRCSGMADASVTTDDAAAAAWLGTVVPAARHPHPRRLPWALAFGLGTLALAGTFYASLTPIARAVARHVPPRVEADLGQGLSLVLATQYCETPEARAALSHLAVRLGALPSTELHILDAEAVNAFTFPGGVVVVTRGLLGEARGPDEVAGVLAHELEHVRSRHVTIRFIRGSLMTLLWQASVGDYSGLLVVDPKTALDVANLRFSRDDEREADRGALTRLAAAHVSHHGFEQFFERMRAKTDAIPAWLSSHPASAERLEHLRTAAAAAGSTTAALGAPEWDKLKHGCAKR
jgi:Zn-dependent protease with chaperone function